MEATETAPTAHLTESPCQIEHPVQDSEVHIENISSIITIVIASIGIIFNMLNIIISSSKPSKASLHVYLVALSVVDFFYLVCVLPSRAFRCGSACPPPTTAAKLFEAYIYLPFGNMLAAMDTFITVSWGIHRLTYIHSPRRIQNTSSVPLKSVIGSGIVSVALHLPYFFKWKLNEEKGVEPTEFAQSQSDLHYGIVLMVLTKALPIATLCISNMLLIINVNRAIKKRRQLVSQLSKQARDITKQTRLNILLIAIICLMIIGNTPVVFSYPAFSKRLFNLEDECLTLSIRYRTFRAISNLVEQLQYSLNFVVYYAMNSSFRFTINQFLHEKFHICLDVGRNAVAPDVTETRPGE